MGDRSPRVVARACVLVILIAVVVGSAFVGTAPRVRADPATVPWSTPAPLAPNLTYEEAQNIVYDGRHGIDTVVESTNTVSYTNNLTFIAQSDSTLFGPAPVAFESRPNDQVGGVGTAAFTGTTGLDVDAQGRIYVAWTRNATYSGGIGNTIEVSTSLDQGHTWARIVRASAANDTRNDYEPEVHVAPDGRVWVAYLQYGNSLFGLTLAVSSDHAATFSQRRNVTDFPLGSFPEAYDFAIDALGRLHLAYNACTDTGGCSLLYTWSDDGVTWSAPDVLANASAAGPYRLAWDPSLAINGSTVHLDWYDSRLTPTGFPTMIYARSTDRGATWSTPIPISQGLSEPFATGARLSAFGNTVMAVWGASGGFAWALSTTDGATWAPEQNQPMTPSIGVPMITVDANGTFHVAALGNPTPGTTGLYEVYWNGPPDAPASVAVASAGAGSLRVTWKAPPQGDVAAYDVWVSPDGSTYAFAGTVAAPATEWTGTGLANGTYWVKVDAVDTIGQVSPDSVPASGVVGPSGPSNAALLDALGAQLNLVTVLLVIVVALVAVETVLLVRQMRRPKPPAPAPAEPKHPEDEL